ncbi:hypothetical protein AURDEDRAFT_177267 [Auricularia subglabra TFB-10046 SS5]|uniref:Uncharacterized protein n=1 Tax=Auricularia subglabra (strain TFB-10046 / SS5) TaxID=717982 RepID=J0D4H7_AURST|nr:hypothetical protein AURDEDRAFT_177267 [Auricularia subglabra TFB-10046 SS5]
MALAAASTAHWSDGSKGSIPKDDDFMDDKDNGSQAISTLADGQHQPSIQRREVLLGGLARVPTQIATTRVTAHGSQQQQQTPPPQLVTVQR